MGLSAEMSVKSLYYVIHILSQTSCFVSLSYVHFMVSFVRRVGQILHKMRFGAFAVSLFMKLKTLVQ